MKNREIIMRRLETIESNMSKLDFILKRQGSRDEFENVIDFYEKNFAPLRL
jgi:hypothetical protein